MEREKCILTNYPILPHLFRCLILTGNLSREVSPPSDYSAVSHPSLPVSRAYPVPRAKSAGGSSVRPRRYVQTREGRGRGRTDDRRTRRPAKPRRARRPAGPPRTPEGREPLSHLRVRASKAPTALLGGLRRARAGRTPQDAPGGADPKCPAAELVPNRCRCARVPHSSGNR